MLGHVTIRSYDDPVTALRKLHWSLVPEFLVLDGKDSKSRLRNYSLVLSEAELGHIERLCGAGLRSSRPQRPRVSAGSTSKGNSGPSKKTRGGSAKKAFEMGRLF